MFDVVTLAPGQGRFLSDCIESVQAQEGMVRQHIVVDPSRDSEIAAVCARQLRESDLLLTDEDDGPPSGLNNGLEYVEAPYFAYLNADDRLLPHALCEVEPFLRNADVAVGDAVVIDEAGKALFRHLNTRVTRMRLASRSTQVVQQSTFYRTEAVRGVGGFNESNNICWDTELLLDLYMDGYQFAYSRAVWAEFRLYADSITGSGRLMDEYRRERARLARKAGYPHLEKLSGQILGRLLRYSERPELLLEGWKKHARAT